MRNPKNSFYRKLRLDQQAFGAIRFYNEIKYYMLRDIKFDERKTKKREKN